jgi:hypothetical protein
MPYGEPGLRDYLSMMWAAVRYRFWRPKTTTPSRLVDLQTTSDGKAAHRTWPDLPDGEAIVTASEVEQRDSVQPLPELWCKCGHFKKDHDGHYTDKQGVRHNIGCGLCQCISWYGEVLDAL